MTRLTESEPFLGSSEEKQGRGTTARFFSAGEYARLRGNPLLGYWDVGKFTWIGGARVAWGGVRSVHPSAKSIRGPAWLAAFRQVAAREGLQITPSADVTVEGACLAAVIDPTPAEPVPGVLLELRLRGPRGTLLYRVSMGKASVEDAMGAALQLVVSFARQVNPTGASRGAAR